MKLAYSMFANYREGTRSHMETIYVEDYVEGPTCNYRHLFGACNHRSCGMAFASRMMRWIMRPPAPTPHVGYATQHSIQDPFTNEVTVQVLLCDHAPGESCDGRH